MTYDYKCPYCGFRFEVKKSVKDIDRVELCPVCRLPAERLFARPAIVVKGRGKYTVSYPKDWNKKLKQGEKNGKGNN